MFLSAVSLLLVLALERFQARIKELLSADSRQTSEATGHTVDSLQVFSAYFAFKLTIVLISLSVTLHKLILADIVM